MYRTQQQILGIRYKTIYYENNALANYLFASTAEKGGVIMKCFLLDTNEYVPPPQTHFS